MCFCWVKGNCCCLMFRIFTWSSLGSTLDLHWIFRLNQLTGFIDLSFQLLWLIVFWSRIAVLSARSFWCFLTSSLDVLQRCVLLLYSEKSCIVGQKEANFSSAVLFVFPEVQNKTYCWLEAWCLSQPISFLHSLQLDGRPAPSTVNHLQAEHRTSWGDQWSIDWLIQSIVATTAEISGHMTCVRELIGSVAEDEIFHWVRNTHTGGAVKRCCPTSAPLT